MTVTLSATAIALHNFEPGNCPANGLNQLTTCGFIYDAAGNLRYDGNNTYTYDAENRIIQVNGLAGTWSYVYDGDGERVEKCAGTSCSTTATLYWRSGRLAHPSIKLID